MVLTRFPLLLRRASAHPLLALVAVALAVAGQYWATQVVASVELAEPVVAGAGEEVVLGGLGADPRLLSLEARGSLDVRVDRARLAPDTAALLEAAGLGSEAEAVPVAWLSASGDAVPSLLEIRREAAGPGPASLRLRPLPSPGAEVARLELEGNGPLAVTLGAGQLGAPKRLVVGERSLAVDGALPVRLALPEGAALRFALALAEPGGAVSLAAGTLREGEAGPQGLALARLSLGAAGQPPSLAACGAPPRAWLWRGLRSLVRGACPSGGPALYLATVELAPARLTLGLAGHAWLWRDGRPVGRTLSAWALGNPAVLALILTADGVLAAWLALALLSLRRRGRYRVFISYRRGDSAGHAGRLRDCLEEALGRDAVFLDVNDIPPGTPFGKLIVDRIAAAESVVAVISRYWLEARDEAGRRRLDDPGDWVRREVETALQLGKRLIPVLVGGASMPGTADLPPSLQALAGLHAVIIEEAHFQRDAEALAEALEQGRASAPEAPLAAGP